MVYESSKKGRKGETPIKPTEVKTSFVQLRAEGKSYDYIAKELGISKGTCSAWEKELKEAVQELKQEQLAELYDNYAMTKEARVRRLGDTLNSIEEALSKADLESIPAEKLLDYKLKYTEALKNEYTGTAEVYKFADNMEAKDIVQALADLLARVQTGQATQEQAQREMAVLSSLLKAYDTVEIQAKIKAIEIAIGGR